MIAIANFVDGFILGAILTILIYKIKIETKMKKQEEMLDKAIESMLDSLNNNKLNVRSFEEIVKEDKKNESN